MEIVALCAAILLGYGIMVLLSGARLVLALALIAGVSATYAPKEWSSFTTQCEGVVSKLIQHANRVWRSYTNG